MFISTARVWHSQQIFIRDFPGKKILIWVFVAAISSQRRKKKKQTLGTNVPRHSSARAATGWELKNPRKPEFSNPPAPAARYVLDWVLKVMNLQSVLHSSGNPVQLFWVFLPSRMGTASASVGGVVSTFKKSELTWEWKLLPPTSNTVVKVHCRAGSFSSLL